MRQRRLRCPGSMKVMDQFIRPTKSVPAWWHWAEGKGGWLPNGQRIEVDIENNDVKCGLAVSNQGASLVGGVIAVAAVIGIVLLVAPQLGRAHRSHEFRIEYHQRSHAARRR